MHGRRCGQKYLTVHEADIAKPKTYPKAVASLKKSSTPLDQRIMIAPTLLEACLLPWLDLRFDLYTGSCSQYDPSYFSV